MVCLCQKAPGLTGSETDVSLSTVVYFVTQGTLQAFCIVRLFENQILPK